MSSSALANRRTPPLKLEPTTQTQQTQAHVDEGSSAIQPSPTDSDSITPRTTASNTESTMTAIATSMSEFQAPSYSPASSHIRTASDAQSGSDSYPTTSPTTSRQPSHYGHNPVFSAEATIGISNQHEYGRSGQQYQPFYNPRNLLLHIPVEPSPELSYPHENSPFCSSASDSTYSTQSDVSRPGRNYNHSNRARSQSINNTPDWVPPYPHFPTHESLNTPHASQFDPMINNQFEQRFSSPGMNTPAVQSIMEFPSAYGDMQYMDSTVGISALPTFTKSTAQLFPASPRSVESAVVEINGGHKMQSSHHSIATSIQSSHLQQQQQHQQLSHLDPYLETYWESFHQKLPIIHRGTFDYTEDTLLSSAMAAIGTQYHDSTAARQKGMELNEFCKRGIDHVSISKHE